MCHLVLLLLCVHLGAAGLVAQTEGGAAQPARLGKVVPVDAEVSIYPATEANAKKAGKEGIRADFETALGERRVFFSKVIQDGKLAPYKLADPGPTFWVLARDHASESIYRGLWNKQQASGPVMEKLPDAYQATEGLFGKKAEEALEKARRIVAVAASGAEQSPAAATITGAPAETANRPTAAGVTEQKPSALAAVGRVLAVFFYGLCCVVVLCTCPLMYYLARWQRRELIRGKEELLARIGAAHGEISVLRREVDALRARDGSGDAPLEQEEERGSIRAAAPAARFAPISAGPRDRVYPPSSRPAPAAREPVAASVQVPEKTADALAGAFVRWCGLENVASHELRAFQRFLHDTFGRVESLSIYRDRNAGRENLTFLSRSGDAQDPTEYWLLQASGGQWRLFPRPDFDGFCELFPAFENNGPMTPRHLKGIMPGRVEPGDGGTYQLVEKGSLA